MKRPLAWLAGALGLAGAYRALKQRPEPAPAPVADEVDPRAEELRRRLEEAKPLVAEREQERFEAGEQPLDEADPEARRRDVHERARAAIEEMRRPADGDRD
ncbi:MAG TPA: hypothetical protein VFL66_03825 [Gaiellaceae bacterium]|nr:hypothetical protein [Gaiellaceae bacterium]